ncbi:MAG: formyltransferase family protein [Halodesulfovibrio sp.]
MGKSVLFLGYDRSQTKLISCLEDYGCDVDHTQSVLGDPVAYGVYDLIVSFGYRHIIKKDFINNYDGDIVNLHISYLPWNRGAHPNFWAYFDNTPHGITIHLIDEGVDTGPILYQRYVNFDGESTFSESYKRLIDEIEDLFVDNIGEIISSAYVPKPQRGEGSYHSRSELPDIPGGWEANVFEVLGVLDRYKEDFVLNRNRLIDQIEDAPSTGAIFRDLLKLAFKYSPREASEIVSRMECGDSKAYRILKNLTKHI